jgi:hypothetical protein
MMPIIPTRTSSQASPKQSSGGPNLVQATPQVAFGGQQAEALRGVGNAVQSIGSVLANHAAKMREEEVTKQALELSNAAHTGLVKYVSGDALLRTGDKAQGVSVEYGKVSDDIFNKSAEGIKDQAVVATARQMYSQVVAANEGQIITHEAQQMRASRNSAAQASVGLLLDNSLAFGDLPSLLTTVNAATATLKRNMEENGEAPEVIEKKVKDVREKAYSENLTTLMATDPVRAKANLEKLKDQLSADTYVKVSKAIDGKVFELKQPEFWDKLAPKVAREDGSYDTEGIRAFVNNMEDVTPDMKEKLFDYFKGRAGDAERKYKDDRANNDLSFSNDMYKLKKDGKSIDETKRILLSKYARYGAKDLAEKERDINKAYEPPSSIDDSEVYSRLYIGIQTNILTDADVNKERDNLSKSHFDSLKKEYNNNIINAKSGYKGAWDEIGKIMDANGMTNKGKGKVAREQFTAALIDRFQRNGGGTADDLIALAQEETKKKTVSKGWLWDTKQAQYKIENPNPGTPEFYAVQRINAANLKLKSEGKPQLSITTDLINNVISKHPEWKNAK